MAPAGAPAVGGGAFDPRCAQCGRTRTRGNRADARAAAGKPVAACRWPQPRPAKHPAAAADHAGPAEGAHRRSAAAPPGRCHRRVRPARP
ncbi:hypothetical protein G6F63_016470 [Rhizopus arrhizus]|nr:hypothetical protein G6F63_016470 [Rhizopus arrhizus]